MERHTMTDRVSEMLLTTTRSLRPLPLTKTRSCMVVTGEAGQKMTNPCKLLRSLFGLAGTCLLGIAAHV